MSLIIRFRAAGKAALLHFLGSLLVACLAAVLVLWVWYPHPYGLLSGGRNLFLILVSVDVVCGPLLTFVLFNPRKPQRELLTDMSLVILVQLAALVYGLHTAYEARPLYLVHEVDRFRVITSGDYGDVDVRGDIARLDTSLQPHWLKGPQTVGIRAPKDSKERRDVMLESVGGGRDYSQRPDFYLPYDTSYQSKALVRTKPLKSFLDRYPQVEKEAMAILNTNSIDIDAARFLPVIHKQDWVAVLDASARIVGFLPGDGFTVP
jgi:hypothetical protein